MNAILDDLNEPQKKAVLHDKGALLVLAGAGSGKTRVITRRFAYLIQNQRLSLKNILAVTFTNKAAGEMKERISRLIGQDTRLAWIRTFHSMGVRLLRMHAERLALPSTFVIYDDTDSKNLIKGIMKDLNISSERYQASSFYGMITRAKDKLQTLDEFKGFIDSEMKQFAVKIFEEYQNTLNKNKAVDFSDLIGLPVRLFRDNQDIRRQYQDIWRYIMVDEFQDTNKAQYELLQLIVNDEQNICAVGDDDQSIYGWRGARVENIYDFKKRYQAAVIPLEQNYRSTSVILDAANQVVCHIPNRMPKSLWTEKKSENKIVLLECDSDRAESKEILKKIEKMSRQYSYSDMAIFYRTNAQSRLFEETFLRANIPYKIFGGQKFYERKEIKDVLSYLKLIVNPYDGVSFSRIINVPKRKIGAVSVEKILSYTLRLGLNFVEVLTHSGLQNELGAQAFHQCRNLGEILSELASLLQSPEAEQNSLSPSSIVKILLEAIHYREYLEEADKDGLDRWSNVEELINSIRQFEVRNPEMNLVDFLADVTLQTSADENNPEVENYISLMTIHNAKGLEYPVVFVSGVIEGLIPLKRGEASTKELEEETRLFYVAITRAKDHLILSYPKRHMRYGNIIESEKSTFLKNIDEDLLEIELIHDEFLSSQRRPGLNRNFTFGKKSYAFGRASKDMSAYSTGKSLTSKPPKTKEIESLESLSVGDNVYHKNYGQGKVSYLSDKMVKIDFEEYGVKSLTGSLNWSLSKVVDDA